MKLPFTFGIQLVYRLLLPGYIVALAAYPLLVHYQEAFVDGYSPFFATNLLALFAGWLFVLLDMHVYMLLEGRRYWPKWAYKWGLKRQASRVKRLYNDMLKANKSGKNAKSKIEEQLARRDETELSVKLRWYPVRKDDGSWYASQPTRLGNILDAYESYPNDLYGLQAMFYWPKLWLLITDDERKEIDGQQAIVDGATYATVALWLASALMVVTGYVVGPRHFWLVPLLMLASFFIYRGSLYGHAQFGTLFKAIFDVHHDKLPDDEWAKVIIEELKGLKTLDQVDLTSKRGRFMNIYRWQHNRRIKVGDKVLKAADLVKAARKVTGQ